MASIQLAAQVVLAVAVVLGLLGGVTEVVKRMGGTESNASTDVPVPKWFVYVGLASCAILAWIAFA